MQHILVCDDEKDIVAALKIYLESDGYCVHTAYSGEEALRVAKTEPRGDDADVARGERLAHDAGIEDGHGFVGHGLQTLVALVEDLVGVLAQRGVRLVANDDADLALVNDRVKFGLDLGIEHLADVAELEAAARRASMGLLKRQGLPSRMISPLFGW